MSDLCFKHNSTHEKQINLLMILNKENKGWHYLAVKKLSALIRGAHSKHNSDFYCINCLQPFRLKKKYVKIKILVEL